MMMNKESALIIHVIVIILDYFLKFSKDISFCITFSKKKTFSYFPSLSSNTAYAQPKHFSGVTNHTQSSIELDTYFRKITEMTFQWGANFNPDCSKQAKELIFSCRYLTKSCRDELPLTSKLFVDNTLFFKVVKNHNQCGIDLNINLKNISKWRFQSNKL